jgi:hypothetical protein
LTCDDVARATRVPVRMIVAIEKDDWGKLPGGIFTRGYLRAYADEVGLEGASVVAQYEAEHAPPPPPEAAAGGRDADDDAWHITIRAPRWSLSSVAWGRLAWPALAGGLLLAFYLTAGGAPDEDPVGQSGSAEASAQQPSNSLGGREERPVGTAATSASDAGPGDIPLPLPGVEVPLAVDLAVTRPCWLTVTVDGSRQIYRLVQPGERERQQGREFVIRAGDAGALRLSVDGQAAKPVGASGEVITFRVTRENYRSLLQASPALF